MAEQEVKQKRNGHLTLWLGILAIIIILIVIQVDWMKTDVELGRKSRESSLKAHLIQIRNAIDQFKTDTGCYPVVLTDMVLPQNVAPKYGVNADGKRVPLPAGKYQGPYLQVSNGIGGIPVNPYNELTESDVSDHWTYQNGVVHPAGPDGKTLDGIPYTEL